MYLERLVKAGDTKNYGKRPSDVPIRPQERTFHKISFKVAEIDLGASSRRSKVWFTLKPQSPKDEKTPTEGKIQSNKVAASDATFNIEHEMLIDTHLVKTLVFKVKTSSSILNRKLTVGAHHFKLPLEAEAKQTLIDDTVVITDDSGVACGKVRLSLHIMPTPFPALHCSPQPFWKLGPTTIARQYSALVPDKKSHLGAFGDHHLVTYSREGSNKTVMVQGAKSHFTATQIADKWAISEQVLPSRSSLSPPSTRLFLHCHRLNPDVGQPPAKSSPLHFSLRRAGGPASLVLVPGNMFAPDVGHGSSRWGVWTLVRVPRCDSEWDPTTPSNRTTKLELEEARLASDSDSDLESTLSSSLDSDCSDSSSDTHGAAQLELERSEFVGLIHLAGPCVECRAAHELGLTLAVANAMFWASVLHSPARQAIHNLIRDVTAQPTCHVTGHVTTESGRGFFPVPRSELLKVSGPAGDQDQVEAGRLGGLQGACCGLSLDRVPMERRIRINGSESIGGREELFVMNFLRGAKSAGSGHLQQGAMVAGFVVATELDWTGSALLGIPFL